MLKIKNLSKIFGSGQAAVTALHEVDFAIAEGEFFTLLGPSGCGKTTLLRLIAGFEPPSGGALILDGKDISTMPPDKRPVNTVFQNYALFPHMTVAQNVAFGLEALGRSRAKVAERVDAMLELVQMTHLRDRKSTALSGGQQQRVALARALAPEPRILLLDEPLSALDLKLRRDMQVELKRLQAQTGLTFIFVTHDQEEALTMSDRIAVMSGGRVQQIAAPHALYDQPANRFVAGFIGETNFLAAQPVAGGLALTGLGGALLPGPASYSGPVSVLIRPEHVVLGQPEAEGLRTDGRIERLIFSGTDTHVHLQLAGGETLVVRTQNRLRGGLILREGDTVPLVLPFDALQVLPDDAAQGAAHAA